MSLETGSTTVTWEIKGVQALLEEKEGVERSIESPKFDNDRWYMVFKVGEKEGWCSFWLGAVFKEDQKDEAGNTRREKEYELAIQLVESSGKVLHSQQIKRDSVGQYMIDGEDTILLRCTISTAPFLPKPPLLPNLVSPALVDSFKTLFEDSSGDIRFVFENGGEEGGTREVLAHKALLTSRFPKIKTLLVTDPVDASSNDAAAPHALKPLLAVKTLPDKDDDDTIEWLPEEWLQQHGAEDDEDDSGQSSSTIDWPTEDGKQTVKIVDFGFTTFRAFLYYVYTEQISFAPPASTFVVELVKRTSGTGGDETDKADVLTSRRAYLLSLATEAAGPIEPTSAHAIYRLADRLEMEHLKKLAKEAIVKGFTVENVLYELISSFSHRFEDVQQAALDFALQHWSVVKNHAAFERVVLGSCLNRIEGAGEIWMKLLKKLPAEQQAV
ncbi:hypothetical protein JCM10213v2_001001 [Rhodosporidiobolus nylandii]